jgi:hypothetical protein
VTRYAAQTEVSSDKSRSEIERTLSRYGATAFMYGWDENANKAVISFKMADRFFKFLVPLPDRKSREFTHTPDRGKLRSPDAAEKSWEQGTRQRWRAIALLLKAVLEAAESGIKVAEDMLQSLILLPDGQTVADWMRPQVERAYLEGTMPSFLPMLEHKE